MAQKDDNCDNETFRICTLRRLAIGILTVALIAFVTVYLAKGKHELSDVAEFIAWTVSAYGVLFSAVITSFNLLDAETQRKVDRQEAERNMVEQRTFDKKCRAFGYTDKFDSQPMKEARDITRELKENSSSISEDELVKRIEISPEDSEEERVAKRNLKRSVIMMFNFFEEMYLAVINDVIDRDIIMQTFAEMFVDLYKRFSPWLENDKCSVRKQKVEAENLKELNKLCTNAIESWS